MEVCKIHAFCGKGGVTGEGDGYRDVVRPKGGKGGPHRIRKEMPAQKGDIWQGGLALGGEASGDWIVVIKVAKHHLVSMVLQ